MHSARIALSAVRIFELARMLVIWIVLMASWRLVAGYCDANRGPAGSLECVAFREYNNKYQWSTCLSNAYIMVKSGGAHGCADEKRRYCYYQCMLESHEVEKGPVFYDCGCDPYSSLKTPLPAECYSPDGTDCSWYKQCLQAKYNCKESGSSFAIEYGERFCNLYIQHYSNFNATGRLWINAARKCLQVALVPLIRQYTSVSCSKIQQTAYDSYSGCYTNPYLGASSICKQDVKTILQVFVTIKSTFIDDFFATGDQLLESALQCGGVYAENTVKIVLDGVYTTTDSIATIYNQVMKGLRSFLKKEFNLLADEILIAPFSPKHNTTHSVHRSDKRQRDVSI